MQRAFFAFDSILSFTRVKIHELFVSQLGVKGVVLSIVSFAALD
jgi:hypothetical protein